MNELREIVLNIVRNRSCIHHGMRVEKIEKQREADRIVGLIDAGKPHNHALSKELEFFSILQRGLEELLHRTKQRTQRESSFERREIAMKTASLHC